MDFSGQLIGMRRNDRKRPNPIAGRRLPSRALAVTTATRWEALRDIPTVGDIFAEGSQWNGLGAPRNTPTEIIDKLNKEINAGLADSSVKTQLAARRHGDTGVAC